ncbi:MAG: hypothetical protein Q7S16_02820 [bacterium]|nr:hypothetical protein [bacterium]
MDAIVRTMFLTARVVRSMLRRRWIAGVIMAVCAVWHVASAYWIIGGVLGALTIVQVIVHELGHYAAARICGVRILGVFLSLPTPGTGATIPDQDFETRQEEALFIAGGPIACLVLTLLSIAVWQLTGWESLRFATIAMGFAGAAELIPINPLDGGWLLKSVFFSFGWRWGIGFLIWSCIACIAIIILTVIYGYGDMIKFSPLFFSAGFFSGVELLLYTRYTNRNRNAWETIIGEGTPMIVTNTIKTPMRKSVACAFIVLYVMLVIAYIGIFIFTRV